MLAYVTTPKRHTTPYHVAQRYIQAHGHFAAVTKDGLLVLTHMSANEATDIEGDCTVEFPHVFPVDSNGNVSSHDVRVWLGY